MLRSVGPDIAIFDPVILPGAERPLQYVATSRTIVGMNRCQQSLIGKRLARAASEEFPAGVGSLEVKFRKMQFQRPEAAGVERGLQQAFAFGEILENGAGLVLAAPAADRAAS